jgi:NAD(P)H-dependent FMN reductase
VLLVLTASTRPVRRGPAVSSWVLGIAQEHDAFEVRHVDLAELALPFLDEPEEPSDRRYVHDHTKRWSATVTAADAVVIVTPEYNHGYPAALKNALDFLYYEWRAKPVGLVAYGGVAAGTRCLQQLKPVLLALGMFPVLSSVVLRTAEVFDAAWSFSPGPGATRSVRRMLDDVARTEAATRALRTA